MHRLSSVRSAGEHTGFHFGLLGSDAPTDEHSPGTMDHPHVVPARRTSSRTRLDWGVALFAFAAIAAHDFSHVAAGRYWDAFWVCNVSAALIGPAILLRSPVLSIAALTWLLPGTIVWLADALVAGSNILPTSYPVHIGGMLASAYAVRRSGHSPLGWVTALAVLAASVLFSKLFLPVSANVNAAHSIPKGWGFLGRSRASFAISGSSLVALCCFFGSLLARRIAQGGRGRQLN